MTCSGMDNDNKGQGAWLAACMETRATSKCRSGEGAPAPGGGATAAALPATSFDAGMPAHAQLELADLQKASLGKSCPLISPSQKGTS